MTNDTGAGRIFENVIGPTAPVLAVVTSFQEQLEWWLRVASLLIGILIGCAHLYRILARDK